MGKVRSVFKNEFINTVSRRSFILSLILVPLIPAILLGLLNILNKDSGKSLQDIFVKEISNPLPLGVVDLSGRINSYPDWLVKGSLIQEPDEVTARQKTENGELQGFYRISADYMESGSVVLVKPEVSIVTEMVQSGTLSDLIDYNLLGSDQALYLKYTSPIDFQFEPLNPASVDQRDPNSSASFFLPYGVTMFFYMMILITSSLMLNAVGKEKENKVMEVLLTSVKPIDIFIGKMLALGSAGLLQMMVWFGSGVLLLRAGGTVLNIPANVQIPLTAILFAVPFFVLGYALYGSLMAGLGAMAPNLREANQSTVMITMPLIFTILAISSLVQAPHESLSVFLSLFPLTSSVAMMARLSIGNVPFWQVLLSMGILILTVILVIRGVANMFRAQSLLTGQKFKPATFLKTLLHG